MHPFIYDIIYTIAFLIYCPFFLGRSLIRKKNLINVQERFGFIEAKEKGSGKRVWFHAVSVGEYLSIRKLIDELLNKEPSISICISTATPAAYLLAKKISNERCYVFLFPFDWSFVIKRVIEKIKPDVVVVAESEFWPNFLYYCKQFSIPLIIVNGRVSEKSYRRYKLFKRFFINRLSAIKLFCLQTDKDAERLRKLGVDARKIVICGNMKYDIKPPSESEALAMVEKWSDNKQIILAASTMNGEEIMILDLYRRLKKDFSDLKLIIAPRHSERSSELEKILSQAQLSYCLRSKGEVVESDVFVLDTIGELSSIIKTATVVIMGGSIKPYGGHNIIEPAYFKKAIVVGEHMENFAEVIENFLQEEACVQTSFDKFYEVVKELLKSEEKRISLGERAYRIVERNSGATDRVFKYIEAILQET